MKLTKILALILTAVLCLALLASCGVPPTNDAEDSTAQTTETEAPKDSETESENESDTSDGRFDYANEDPADYISLDRAKYSSIKLTLPTALEVDETAVADYIQLLCENYATLSDEKITDRAVKEGDVAMIYYEGYRDGELFAGGSNMSDAEPHALEIGSGSFIPGFEEGLIGIVPSETSRENMVDLPLTFPEDYRNSEMAGVEVVFKVYIEYITESVPAEYTEEFITETLQYTATSDDIKGEFEAYIESYLLSTLESEIKGGVWYEIVDNLEVISLPESEVDYYYDLSLEEYEYYIQYAPYFWGYSFSDLDSFVPFYLYQAYGYELGEDESWENYTKLTAERTVKQNLAYRYIADKEGFVVSDAAYEDAVNYYVDYYAYYGQTYTAEQIIAEIGEQTLKDFALFEIVTAFLMENCTVTYAD